LDSLARMAAPRGQKIIRRDADGKAYVAGGGKGGDPSHKARSALASEVRHSQSKSEIAAQERSVDAAALRDDDVASAFEGKGLLLSIEAQLVDLKADVHLLRVHVLGKRGSLAKTESKPEVTMELCRAATASVLSSKPSIFSTRYAPRSWISAAELMLKAVGGNGALSNMPGFKEPLKGVGLDDVGPPLSRSVSSANVSLRRLVNLVVSCLAKAVSVASAGSSGDDIGTSALNRVHVVEATALLVSLRKIQAMFDDPAFSTTADEEAALREAEDTARAQADFEKASVCLAAAEAERASIEDELKLGMLERSKTGKLASATSAKAFAPFIEATMKVYLLQGKVKALSAKTIKAQVAVDLLESPSVTPPASPRTPRTTMPTMRLECAKEVGDAKEDNANDELYNVDDAQLEEELAETLGEVAASAALLRSSSLGAVGMRVVAQKRTFDDRNDDDEPTLKACRVDEPAQQVSESEALKPAAPSPPTPPSSQGND